MDDSSLGLSSFQQLGTLKPWLQMPRFRLGTIYEQRVARIRRDCRILHQPAEPTSIGDNKNAFIPNEAQYLRVRERGDLFLERCRQEWLSFHIMGALLSGYESPYLCATMGLEDESANRTHQSNNDSTDRQRCEE